MKNRIILVSGMSGAGKTTAMGILEDMGYHCMDQFPVKLLPNLLEMITLESDTRFHNLALSTNLVDFNEFKNTLGVLDIDLQILILESSNQELLKRYKFTRRTHPMLLSNIATTLEDGIQIERERLSKLKEQNCLVVDTSFLNATELKQRLNKVFAINNRASFSISFISFGYKNGLPMDADLLFDVRFLPNPYWVEALRSKSGNDQEVFDYVMTDKETKRFIKKLKPFLDYAFKQYIKEGKNHFTVGIGCTGGMHRSVSIVNWLFDEYGKKYHCFKEHRDLE
ncbi:MAG: RNase adapter RapZ [Erysipelotrichaceae bacterium]|nr:RNase adapter RapZ [Erysipelotrichaceae bacterium]